MSLLKTEMRRSCVAQRGVSQGAAITLVTCASGYRATFECAQKCASVLGNRGLVDYETEGERLPVFFIYTEEMHRSLAKLAETFSVALVDTVTDDSGTRFALVWKIAPTRAATENQGGMDLDEY
jgi:hypothetical protein